MARLEKILEGKTLTLKFEGNIDSISAPSLEVEALKSIKRSVDTLVLDFKKVDYISSAGLRMVLKLVKEREHTKIVNASLDVYSVFEMTGFTQIIEVHRALREISIEGCPLIGQGAYGRVYRLNGDTILKSFYKGNSIQEIERERELAREAFLLGIPTAISYDVVKVKEESFGAVYELIEADNMLEALQKHPLRYHAILHSYVSLLNKLSASETDSPNIPYASEDLRSRLSNIVPVTEPELFEAIKKKLETLKDCNKLVHGDCHFKNVFLTKDGPVLIDMDTLMRGDPILELANIYRTYVVFEEVDSGNCKKFLGVDGSYCKKLFYDLFDILVPKKEQEELLKKVAFLAYFLLLSHYALKQEKYAPLIEKVLDYLRKAVDSFESF